MNKFVLATIIGMFIIGPAAANDRHHRPQVSNHHGHHGHHGHHRSHNWVAPLIVGGAIGYGATRYYSSPGYYSSPRYYYYAEQPIPMHQPLPSAQCTRYIYQDSYGNTTKEETRCD